VAAGSTPGVIGRAPEVDCLSAWLGSKSNRLHADKYANQKVWLLANHVGLIAVRQSGVGSDNMIGEVSTPRTKS
jgi:hypothetical protein